MGIFYSENGKIEFEIISSKEVIDKLKSEQLVFGNRYLDCKSLKHHNYYVSNGELIEMTEKPSDYHYFDYDLKYWVEEIDFLDKLKNAAIEKINFIAGVKITTSYPIYKQLNIIGTDDYATMREFIDTIRNDADDAKAQISYSIDKEEINKIVSEFNG